MYSLWSYILFAFISLSFYINYVYCDRVERADGRELSCPIEFQGRCSCGKVQYGPDQIRMYVTNCTNANFTDASMLTKLPAETEVLIFTGNNISSLPPNIFGNNTKVRYDKLEIIDLSNNNIEYLRGKTFHNVFSVRKLYLSNNNIKITGEYFHPRLFSNFESLEELYLNNAFGDNNRGINFMEDLSTVFLEADLKFLRVLSLEHNFIEGFPHEFVFCSFQSLQKLLLANNMMLDIRLNLTCNPKLYLLDVSNNFIFSLANESIALLNEAPLHGTFHVNLTRNPFRCDCQLIDFLEFIKTTDIWVNGKKSFTCANGYPPDNIGKPLYNLEPSNLQCASLGPDNMDNYITASYVVLTSLILALLILVSALLYSNRKFISQTWSQISNRIALKREYTSLETEKRQNQNLEVDEVAV